MFTKVCPKCSEKDIDSFGKNKKRKDGRQVYCRDCKKTFDGNYYNRNKQAQYARNAGNRKKLRQELNGLKSSVGCAYCPENDPCCLDFHHLNKDKVASISDLVENLSSKLFDEIKKCEVVCSNCHRKIHAGRKLSLRDRNGNDSVS